LGTLVEIDPADTARVREANATSGVAIGGSGDVSLNTCGILWYEHDSQTIEGQAAGSLNIDLDTAPVDRMVQVLHGKGAKVWLRNTDLDTTEAGLNFPSSRAAVVMVNGLGAAGVAVDDLLGWSAANDYWDVTTTAAEAFLVVTAFDDTLQTLDATLLV
jgi:hypothetical protein